MTTVVNIEDTMPYVEPKVPVTADSVFKDLVLESAADFEDTANYYRSTKEWAKGRRDQHTSKELMRIGKAPDPAKELERTLAELSRQYMDLKGVQVECEAAVRRHIRKEEAKKVTPIDKRSTETAEELLARLDKEKAQREAAREKPGSLANPTISEEDRTKMNQLKAKLAEREAGIRSQRRGAVKGPKALPPGSGGTAPSPSASLTRSAAGIPRVRLRSS